MSAEYRNNHYVPQWYQRQFFPGGQADRELYLLDLRPEWFRDGMGYGDGSTEAMDTSGRRPGQRRFGHEARSAEEITAHRGWRDEFERLFGAQNRGLSWEDRRRERARSTA